MEGLLSSIGDTALVKLAELMVGLFGCGQAALQPLSSRTPAQVRLLMSGKTPEEMLSELKPFAAALASNSSFDISNIGRGWETESFGTRGRQSQGSRRARARRARRARR